jgi:hypothetical protein
MTPSDKGPSGRHLDNTDLHKSRNSLFQPRRFLPLESLSDNSRPGVKQAKANHPSPGPLRLEKRRQRSTLSRGRGTRDSTLRVSKNSQVVPLSGSSAKPRRTLNSELSHRLLGPCLQPATDPELIPRVRLSTKITGLTASRSDRT